MQNNDDILMGAGHYSDFDEYIRHGEPSQREKAEAWKTAIGLQAVDGLKTSEYLRQTALRNIEGELTFDEVKEELRTYYIKKVSRTDEERGEEEADKVSANIAKLLSTPSFAFSVTGLTFIHRQIFDGVFKFAGKLRDYDITKREWVLAGDTVVYAPYQDLNRSIAYDIEQEREFSYSGLSQDETVEHIARFVSSIWQIHPFGEGNTRTTAVFAIKYLRSLGFEVDNSFFAENSWYFRNALVRVNYHNIVKGIEREPLFLVRFFRNLLLGEENELKNRFCHIRWKEFAPQSTPTSTGQVPNKHRTSTEQVPNKLRPSTDQVPNKLRPSTEQVVQLIRAIGNDELTVKEMLERLQLKHRPHFLELYLTPAIQTRFVRMLYPDSPRHPRQKYLLTVKGAMALSELSAICDSSK